MYGLHVVLYLNLCGHLLNTERFRVVKKNIRARVVFKCCEIEDIA
jgi:hypothetical protein